jgi:hypothetical protein
MDTAVRFSLLVFRDRLVENRVKIGGSEDKLEDKEASVIIIIVLITSIIALCDEEESGS